MSLSDEDLKVALTVLQDNLGEQADQSTSSMPTESAVATGKSNHLYFTQF